MKNTIEKIKIIYDYRKEVDYDIPINHKIIIEQIFGISNEYEIMTGAVIPRYTGKQYLKIIVAPEYIIQNFHKLSGVQIVNFLNK